MLIDANYYILIIFINILNGNYCIYVNTTSMSKTLIKPYSKEINKENFSYQICLYRAELKKKKKNNFRFDLQFPRHNIIDVGKIIRNFKMSFFFCSTRNIL